MAADEPPVFSGGRDCSIRTALLFEWFSSGSITMERPGVALGTTISLSVGGFYFRSAFFVSLLAGRDFGCALLCFWPHTDAAAYAG